MNFYLSTLLIIVLGISAGDILGMETIAHRRPWGPLETHNRTFRTTGLQPFTGSLRYSTFGGIEPYTYVQRGTTDGHLQLDHLGNFTFSPTRYGASTFYYDVRDAKDEFSWGTITLIAE